MCKVEPNPEKMMKFSEQTTEDLQERYNYLIDKLHVARDVFEYEKSSEIKTEMVYIIGELRNRRVHQSENKKVEQMSSTLTRASE